MTKAIQRTSPPEEACRNQIRHGDARAVLAGVPAESFDTILTSPLGPNQLTKSLLSVPSDSPVNDKNMGSMRITVRLRIA